MSTPQIIRSLPGIKRDGTQFQGENYTDGEWCRFQRGLPRKIGGYRTVTSRLLEKVYGMSSFSANGNNYIACGEASFLEQAVVDNSGNLSSLNDRTPAGFTVSVNNLWQFDNLPSSVANATDLIAHGAPNLADIDSNVARPIYYGQADSVTALVASGLDAVSGGTVSIGPYVFGYGSGGTVVYSDPNDPTTQNNLARITGQKIIYGSALRGGGSGPAGIFWSLDSLVRASFNAAATGTQPLFFFDELATRLPTPLSSRSIIEYSGVFYWWDTSGPQMFNGVVREVPNDMNINFLLDNLNYAQRQKVFAVKIPRWGEIWWFVPLFGATECNWAIILNVRENIWYDTAVSTRTSGVQAQVFPKPFMTDAVETATGFSLWQHETGTDAINGSNVNPIPSFFQTADITMLTTDQPADKNLSVAVVEPDFVQSGDMTVQVKGKSNARAPEISSDPKTFPEDNGNLPSAQQIVRFKENRREMRFRFDSNTPGGDYQMGQCIAHITPDGGRQTT